MAKRQMVLSAVGPDRPGLVRGIAALIHDAGGNLEDSRMAILAGDFAQIVLFSADDAAIAAMQAKLAGLERELGLEIRVKPATPAGPPRSVTLMELDVTGVDRPGIVHKVGAVLAEMDVNVASLESHLSTAAFHGTPMFSLRAELQLPAGADPETLHDQLDRVCRELHLTYDLTSPDEGETA
jgi:glycine cleavage system transcriptional repressor